jgi:hypothetical protein
MKYMLLICGEDDPAGVEDQEPLDVEPWVEEMHARGIRLQGDRLRPPGDATTVRVRDGELLTSDGPYAETKEWMAGYDIIECENLDEAIEVAAKHPVAAHGLIEIRPFWPMDVAATLVRHEPRMSPA